MKKRIEWVGFCLILIYCIGSMVIDTVCTATTQIAAGYYHTLTLKSDGTLWAWGWNDHGQLGDGSTTDKHSPAQVSAFRI